MLEKGKRWVKSTTTKSVAGVVTFVQQALNETTAWRDRAMVAVTDFLRLPVRYHFPSILTIPLPVGERDQVDSGLIRNNFDQPQGPMERAKLLNF